LLIRQKELRRRHKRAQERYKLRMREQQAERPSASKARAK